MISSHKEDFEFRFIETEQGRHSLELKKIVEILNRF